jgi:hypothetical protein
MHETYRMLGREHEADLEREAARRALGALLPARPPLTKRAAASLRRIGPGRPGQPAPPPRPEVVAADPS